ncbi:alpha/beta fold hydrolase [Filobacillus milosensis]|nr:alpha/beta fold hydrolase [Filobacillus milosensis]
MTHKFDLQSIYYKWIESTNDASADTLIFIHGLGHDHRTWNYIIPYLNESFNILTYDLRGHGKSSETDGAITFDSLAQDLRLLIKELDISNFHIFAQGLGGYVGIQAASQLNLKSLILVGVPINFPNSLVNQIIKREKSQSDEISLLSLAEKMINIICYKTTEEKKEILLDAYKKVKPELYYKLFNLDNSDSIKESLAQVDFPILLMSGAEDSIYPPEVFSFNLNFIKQARYYIVPDASYMIQLDQPELVSEMVKRFIKNPPKQQKSLSSNYRKELLIEWHTSIGDFLHDDLINQELIEAITPRELKVLELLNIGLTNKQIADKLCLTEGTVKGYNHNIYSKFQVNNRTQALQKARKLKIIRDY